MKRALDLGKVSTRLQRIGKLAGEDPNRVLTSLAYCIDEHLLWEALMATRKNGAPGVDKVTWGEYHANWRENLADLKERFKSGQYKAPSLRRSYIPKADGSKRPIAITTLEDKVLQRAVAMVLSSVYEQDFYDFSYGFRPKKSAHQAVHTLQNCLWETNGGWALEVDIKGFFDAISHRHLRAILDQRVKDGVIRRTIDKWLKAGILEKGTVTYPTTGSPQGGVISPLLANIYLHEVLDKWFVEMVLPELKGWVRMVRYADDFVMIFQREEDAKRVAAVIPKRFAKYELEIHPKKTRLVDFRFPIGKSGKKPGTFNFLGFTFHWIKSRKGKWYPTRKTDRKKFGKGLDSIREWCKKNRHLPLGKQQETLNRKLMGHYAYFGIRGNHLSIKNFHYQVTLIWKKWLGRRDQRKRLSWKRFSKILARLSLVPPRIVHSQ